MFRSLDRFGLPAKYAIVGFMSGLAGVLIFYSMGLIQSQGTLIAGPIGTTVGGFLGGYVRKRQGKTD